jgi:hypothetical protein
MNIIYISTNECPAINYSQLLWLVIGPSNRTYDWWFRFTKWPCQKLQVGRWCALGLHFLGKCWVEKSGIGPSPVEVNPNWLSEDEIWPKSAATGAKLDMGCSKPIEFIESCNCS